LPATSAHWQRPHSRDIGNDQPVPAEEIETTEKISVLPNNFNYMPYAPARNQNCAGSIDGG
jgi:hypothetical protein